tara:strand:- start:121 stop:543 length:423 start_codon:yes stop_codon:yes gene_type:complete
MEPDAAEEALRAFGAQSGLAQLVEQYIWWFVIGFALLFLKDSVTNALAGIGMFIGSDYDENMACYIHTAGTRREARISKSTLFSTSFFIYDVKHKKTIDKEGNEVVERIIGSATLLRVPNSELKSLRIERPLENLDLTKE